MQESKYLIANFRDTQWGLTVSTVGYEHIIPGEDYPTHGHADEDAFSTNISYYTSQPARACSSLRR